MNCIRIKCINGNTYCSNNVHFLCRNNWTMTNLLFLCYISVRAINSFEVKLISNSLEKVPGGDESADRQAHGANVWIDIVI